MLAFLDCEFTSDNNGIREIGISITDNDAREELYSINFNCAKGSVAHSYLASILLRVVTDMNIEAIYHLGTRDRIVLTDFIKDDLNNKQLLHLNYKLVDLQPRLTDIFKKLRWVNNNNLVGLASAKSKLGMNGNVKHQALEDARDLASVTCRLSEVLAELGSLSVFVKPDKEVARELTRKLLSRQRIKPVKETDTLEFEIEDLILSPEYDSDLYGIPTEGEGA